jgi:hypothetical protein
VVDKPHYRTPLQTTRHLRRRTAVCTEPRLGQRVPSRSGDYAA